ncbi:helicase HerA-like domain-containing protein [Ponticaulis sp.]|uniref:helicase HerA-like domain-containing protein n=1 Tax=Ponticaulis sp. TaxID=2020902 RepID=UPI000B66C302|nr:helicase HerA-like domain-containing protein [Ponticaulis sp.]MAI91009.1 ATP-binding protein [Ponticaulis sp.]OUX98347.1 MAG: ATP-binding protein [Hyphomonadaceae bacterium TMED5]|tara:strand:+ start:130890 stop:132383 length:1494 start_codon:yes stop_codon:yes gene_type:complete
MSETIFLGGGGPEHNEAQSLLLSRANRHGLIAGATGTGKTVTLQILAQGFADAGVPVFCADVKGDLSGVSQSGSADHKLHDALHSRAQTIGLAPYDYNAAPTIFWDVFGEAGHPVRTTISEMGPTLLSQLMELNETQEGVLTIAFEYADDNNLLLLDLKDLRKLLIHISDIRDEIGREYGNVSPASVGAIQRRLLLLEREGAEAFFGEPALRLEDLLRTDLSGKGYVNILDSTRLINSPRLYCTFLLWLLSELFEQLPEVGDPDKPKLVFFFDEAHLLFKSAPKALLEKIEQVVKLIRSKGVGVFFVTQNPRDIPDSVLAQLGNRIQHALRAYTPAERRAVKAAAESFRENELFDTEDVITDLGTGEALVSTLDRKGVPSIVARTLIRPPSSRLGPATPAERTAVMSASPVGGQYDEAVDRESAYEILEKREDEAAKEAERLEREEEKEKAKKKRSSSRSSYRRQGVGEAALKSGMRFAARELTRYVLRGILGSRSR